MEISTHNFLRVSKHLSPFPPEDEVEEVDSLYFVETLIDPLQRTMENKVNDQQDEELDEATKGLEPQDGNVEEEKFEDLGEIKPEEPQVPEVDLKPLPKGLKYEFLGPDKTYPVIVSDELSPKENEKLLNLLKNHRKVIGYSINDLKGLSPAFCTHRIPMEDQCKPIVDHQRRLTHAMREVLPPFSFIRRELTWHSLLYHTLTTHFLYIILVMVMNLYLLESTFDY
jgi:hypothetical protein